MALDLSGFEALDAVVRCGGFGRAAEKLHRVQSAVSHQIHKLEEQLGVSLFDRNGHRACLTPVGEAVLAQGRRLLAQAEQVRSMARHFSAGWEPVLLIVVDGLLPLDPVLGVLRALAAEKIPTRIQVRVEFLRGVQSCFHRSNGDIMLVADYAPDSNLHEEALPAMDCVLCVAATHVLATARTVTLADLQEHVEISVQHSSEEQGDDRHLFGCERSVFVSSFHTKKEALLMGVGFGWLPLYLARKEIQSGTLCQVRYVGGSHYRFTPRLVHRIDRPPGRAGARFMELLRSAKWPRTKAWRRKI